jgi:preprotein translocase subunit YajC
MIPKELIIIILGCVVVGLMMYRDDYKRKKEQQAYWKNFDDINRERNKRHE